MCVDRRLTEDELLQRLDSARTQVSVGSLYKHYKGNLYKVIDLAILESNNIICVIYRAQYGNELIFIRPVSVWIEEIELDGKPLKRFARVE